VRLLRQGEPAAAEVLLRRLAAASPADAGLPSLLATAAAMQRRPAEAEAHARAALALRPDHPPFHAQLAALLDAAGRGAEAADALEQAVALAPADPALRQRLAALCRKLGRDEDAAAQYATALALKPEAAEILVPLGDVLRDLGQAEAALTAYRRAAALPQPAAEALLRLAAMLLDAGDLDGAEAGYAAALGRGADHAGIHKRLGDIHLRRGAPDRAEAAYRAAVARAPDDPVLRLALAAVLDGRGDVRAAAAARAQAQNVTARRILPVVPLGASATAMRLDDAVVVNGGWQVIHRGRLHDDLAAGAPATSGVEMAEGLPAAFVSGTWPMRFEADPVLLLGGGTYDRWVLEVLPRLAVEDAAPDLRTLPLLVAPDLGPVQMQSLARLGVDPARLRWHPRETLIRCRHLVVPVPPWPVRWLRRRVLGAEPPPGHRRLFLLPRAADDGAALARIAEAAGFTALDPMRLPFDRQVALFAEAAEVAGLGSAAFANLAFAPHGTQVIELAAAGSGAGFVVDLAAALEQPYRRIDLPQRNRRLGIDLDAIAAALGQSGTSIGSAAASSSQLAR